MSKIITNCKSILLKEINERYYVLILQMKIMLRVLSDKNIHLWNKLTDFFSQTNHLYLLIQL